MAVGARLAAPDRPVVALMRDGSIPVPYNYAITALWTASHYGIPMTMVVASNAEYLVTFSNPDSSSVTSPENATRQLAEVPYAVPPPIRPGHSWVLGVEAVDVEVFHSVLIPDLIFAVQVVECPTLAWGHEQ